MALAALGGYGNYGGSGFSAYPSPTTGQGAFGKVPGPINLPPSLYSQSQTAVPGLGPNATQASSDVQSLLQGQVSPDTQDYIQNLIAAKGASSGVEGTPFNTADLVKSLGLTSEQLQTSGLGAYNSLLNTVGQLQLNPSLMAEIGQSNANLLAAPDPAAVHQQMLTDLQNEFEMGQQQPSRWDATTIAGPAPTFGGGAGVGASPFATGLTSNDQVLAGGPGFNPGASTGIGTTTGNSWQDYLNSTFGYQLGNPASPTGSLYDPSSLGAGFMDLSNPAFSSPAGGDLFGDTGT